MDENELSKIIVESAIEVHKTLGGPGLLESVYRDALGYEIKFRASRWRRENLFRFDTKAKYSAHL